MEIRHYTTETLEARLRTFEERFGLGSDEFFKAYRAECVPATVPYYDSFVWADTYTEFGRLRTSAVASSAC